MSDVPIQLRASQTMTVTVFDMESEGRVTITLDGDIGSLLPHLTQFVVDAVKEME